MTFLNLNPRFVYGDVDLTSAPFAVNQEGIDYQNGDLVTSVLSSFLQDGELEVSQGRGNMTLVVPVLIEGSDLLDLAESHATLARAADMATSTLGIDPGDGIAPSTVFETFRGEVAYTYNAVAEQNGFRQYNLTVRALPHGRSDAEVTATAVVIPPGAAPTPVVVNDGSSTAGWDPFGNPEETVTSDGNVVHGCNSSGAAYLRLTQTFDPTTTRWIAIDWYAGPAANPLAYTYGPNLGINFPGSGPSVFAFRADRLPNGYTRSYWPVPESITTVTHLVILMTYSNDLYIDRVARVSAPPALGTNRQQSRAVPVAGSARTQGGIRIYSPTSSLGEVMIYTSDGSVALPLSSMRSSGSISTDNTRVSGAYANTTVASVHDVPLGSLMPGLYSLVALVSAPAGDTRTLNWSTTSRIGSLTVGRTVSGSAAVSGAPYRFVALGNVNLPTNGARANTTATQRVTVVDSSSSGSPVLLDELYLLNLTTGRLSIVSCGDGAPASGGPSSRLWLDAATVASRTPTVMRGTAADGSDAFYANDSIQLLGQHEFVPTSANIFTVTTNATDAEVTLTHFPRWLTHAALVAA